MTLFNSKALKHLKEDLRFLRESQKVTASNIARSNTPDAEPYVLEKSSFYSTLNLAQPSQGAGFKSEASFSRNFNVVVDKENRTEAVPGESRISIENESVRMAEIDDQHNLRLKLMSSWKKAIRMVTGAGG